MKQDIFSLLVSTGTVEAVHITATAAGDGWAIWPIGKKLDDDCIETARGERRIWASLDTAHRWIREQRYHGPILIEATPDELR